MFRKIGRKKLRENKPDIRYLVLWLSDNCNLNCKYCYASPAFQKTNMSFETARKAMELCKDKNFRLVFAGGEPLLNFELIKEIYKYLQEEHYDCKLSMQTNGSLISHKIAEKLQEMEIDIGISFDACIEVHERLRGSVKKTVEGILALKEVGKKINLNCVLSSETLPFLEQLVEYAYYFENVRALGLDLLRIGGNCLFHPEITTVKKEEVYPALKKAYQKSKALFSLTGRKVRIREIEEARFRRKHFCQNTHYCYASLGQSMVVTPQGDSYPCSSFIGNQEYLVGNVQEKIRRIALPSGKYENCVSCIYDKECKGCCPSRMLLNAVHGEVDKDCVLRKAVFQILKEEEEGKI